MSNQSQPPASALARGGGAPSNNNSNNAVATATGSKDASYRLPSNVCISHAMKLAIVEDKPIMLDYWTASFTLSATTFPPSVSTNRGT